MEVTADDEEIAVTDRAVAVDIRPCTTRRTRALAAASVDDERVLKVDGTVVIDVRIAWRRRQCPLQHGRRARNQDAQPNGRTLGRNIPTLPHDSQGRLQQWLQQPQTAPRPYWSFRLIAAFEAVCQTFSCAALPHLGSQPLPLEPLPAP